MQLLHGDCLEVMRDLEADSVDTIITDPPYGLTFMGKNWDHGVPGVPFWLEALRVARPGAFLLAFGGSRTYHRLTCAIEDAGWEIRDCIMWIYASGFPKSLDIGKAIDKQAGAEREVVGLRAYGDGQTYGHRKAAGRRAGTMGQPVSRGPDYDTAPATDLARQWDGYGSALKPAHEPIVVAMKPLDGTFAANAEKHGVAGLWIDGGRIGIDEELPNYTPSKSGLGKNGIYGSSTREQGANSPTRYDSKGRWPANVIFDEASGALLDAQSGERGGGTGAIVTHRASMGYGGSKVEFQTAGYSDTGGASRFFFCAKSSRTERDRGLEGMEARKRDASRHADQPSMNGGDGNPYNRGAKPVTNHHPTVKPLALMEYLCKLTRTPTGGVVLDPFMGSGSTGVACVMTDRDFIGIEQDAEYLEIARARIEAEQAKPKQLGLAI